MAKNKVIKSSTIIKSLDTPSRDCEWLEYLGEESLRLYPGKNDWRKRLCVTMLRWACNDDSLEIQQFCMHYGIPYITLKNYVDTYSDVKGVYDEVKLRLASRRRIGALKRIYDKDVVFKDLHTYDPEWVEINAYHARLKKEVEERSSGNLMVIMERLDDGGLKEVARHEKKN